MKKLLNYLISILVSVLLLNSPVHAAKTVTYYHHDALGSPVAMTDESGNLKCNEDYMPYGERIRKEAGCEENNIWYTGKPEEPDLGLQYFGARWYDPSIGRFTGIDPVKFQEGNVHSFNAYAYANNNPYKFIDPTGMLGEDVLGVLEDYEPEIYSGGADSVSLSDQAKAVGNMPSVAAEAGLNTLILLGTFGAEPSVSVPRIFEYSNPSGGSAVEFYTGGGSLGFLGKATKGSDRLVIGRGSDLSKPGALSSGEKTLSWPPSGSAKSEWNRNAGLLRKEMGKGKPIRDASPGNNKGMYLNAERNLLMDRGWTFDSNTNYWSPTQ